MISIPINQSWLEIELETPIPVAQASSLKIQYIAPDKSLHEVNAVASGEYTIKYNLTKVNNKSELNQLGQYAWYAFLTAPDGREAFGTPLFILVIPRGTRPQ